MIIIRIGMMIMMMIMVTDMMMIILITSTVMVILLTMTLTLTIGIPFSFVCSYSGNLSVLDITCVAKLLKKNSLLAPPCLRISFT